MSGFAAHSDARIKLQIVSDRADMLERGRAVPDQRGVADGRAHLAVPDAISFGAGKYEVAVGYVDLAAPESDRVDAVLNFGNDIARRAVAAEHECVRHPGHGSVLVRLPAPVAGRLSAHEPRVLPILHVIDENSVFDQNVGATRRAFVVDGDRSASIRDRSVVQNRHARRCDPFAQQSGKCRSLLAIEISFKAVADSLVKQNPGPSRAESYIHHARGRFFRIEIDESDSKRLARRGLPSILGNDSGELESAAFRVRSGFAASVLFDDDRDPNLRHRARVRNGNAVRSKDLDFLH